MTPMHNTELEKAVLGAMMTWTPSLAEGCDLLQETDFALDSHRVLFRAMNSMAQTHEQCDLMSLSAWLTGQHKLGAIGGFEYLVSLDENRISGSLKPHRAALREMAKRRMLAGGLRNVLEALECGATHADATEAAQEAIAEASNGGNDLISVSEAAERVRESISPENPTRSLPTGIAMLDVRTGGGLRLGHLWVDGALPARGKSSLGRQVAAYNARQGTPTLVFSIEMRVEEWFGVDIANIAGIESWKMQNPQHMRPHEREQIENALYRVSADVEEGGWPLWFDDNGNQTIGKILARARLAVLRHGVRLIVVDYLQRVEGGGKEELRTRIGNVAKKLAEFGKRYRVAVLLLSQLKRPSDINERPTMTTLKESGDIEAHAHVIVLNYRPIDRQSEDFTGEDELICAKVRFGKPGTVLVRFDPDTMTFQERTA